MLIKPDHCKSCVGWNWNPCGKGYVPSSGTGNNGVLLIGESAGENEANEGQGFVGKAGHYMFSNLARVGIEREGFKLANVLACRPPENKLVKMSYEEASVSHCGPILDETIYGMRDHVKSIGKTFVILAIGRTAFKRVLGLDDRSVILKNDYTCYPIWSEKYSAWVLGCPHPSYLMRGNHHLVQVLCFAFKRALEIAENGLTLDTHQYLLDPEPAIFAKWVEDYMRVADHDPNNTFLSYDIETPFKQGQDEDNVEDNDDYTILRCSFSHQTNHAVSVPWNAQYMPMLEELFGYDGAKVGWNSANYDDARIMYQIPINGDRLDAMLAWHVLNSSLPKALGFVTPFYAQTTSMWKHLSDNQPAFYNAKDADMALRCWLGIRQNLHDNSQGKVFDRHVIKLNRVFSYMSKEGVLLDQEMRGGAETKLAGLLDGVEQKMEDSVPLGARKLKVYKKTPKVTQGMIEVDRMLPVKYCGVCGLLKPTKAHLKKCPDSKTVTLDESFKLWAMPQEFKISKVSLQQYQRVLKHQAIINRKEQKVTFDEDAITRLMKKYPKDELYPLILEQRGLQKLLSTYIGVTDVEGKVRGGMPVGRDNRIHTTFSHNPSTLRSASQNPNLQNLPRPKGADDLATIIRNLIVAGAGNLFTARDYSGIEAVLVGYFALSQRYIRLAKLDIHSFYTAYALHELDGRISASDLPELSWDDGRLAQRLSEIKKEFKSDRNNLYKHLVHGANFFQGAFGAREKIFHETGIEYPVKLVQRVMDIYFELFPEIRRWHTTVMMQTERDGFIRNPFGYIHRFNKVYDYKKIGGKWEKEPGPDANKAIAFLPQSTAAGIIKEAMLRLFFNRYEEAGQYLRLLVHDELFFEVPVEQVGMVDDVVKEEMERAIIELPLPKSYGMGEYLIINTEAKQGDRWGGMH